MSLWLQAKRRQHPRSFLSGHDRTLRTFEVRKPPVRRARAARAGGKRTGVKTPS